MRLKKRSYEIDMCSGPILKKMLQFSLPLMFSGILQLLFNAADIAVVGKFAGDASMAAVGSNGALIGLITNLFMGLSIGANVLTARYYGAREYDRLQKAVHTSMLMSIYTGLFMTMFGLAGAPMFLEWMMTPENVLPLATQYLRIYFIGMPAMMIYNFGSAILRAVGDTKRPLYFLALSGLINVGLNLLFVIVFRMDVAGVALATVISQTLSAVLVVICLMTEDGPIRMYWSKLHLDIPELKLLVRIGLPAGLQGTVFSISNVVIQSSINTFGDIVMAGNTAAGNIEGFVYISMNTFSQATVSFVSQNLGAGNRKRITRSLLCGQGCTVVIGLLLSAAVIVFGPYLLTIYTSSPEVIQLGMRRMEIIVTLYALCGMMEVMVGALRGIGYSMMPMIVSLLGVCGMRLVWIYTVFQMPAYHTIETVYLSYPISWLITFLTHLICYLIVRKKVFRSLPQKAPDEAPAESV